MPLSSSARYLPNPLWPHPETSHERHPKEIELKIELVRAELKKDISETKAELIRWVVAAGFLQSALVIGVVLKAAKLL